MVLSISLCVADNLNNLDTHVLLVVTDYETYNQVFSDQEQILP